MKKVIIIQKIKYFTRMNINNINKIFTLKENQLTMEKSRIFIKTLNLREKLFNKHNDQIIFDDLTIKLLILSILILIIIIYKEELKNLMLKVITKIIINIAILLYILWKIKYKK